MTEPARIVAMRGFTAAVGHAPAANPVDHSGHFSIGLDGVGADRRLAISIRHADGTGLVVYLSDLAMGRFGELVTDAYAAAFATAASDTPRRLR